MGKLFLFGFFDFTGCFRVFCREFCMGLDVFFFIRGNCEFSFSFLGVFIPSFKSDILRQNVRVGEG